MKGIFIVRLIVATALYTILGRATLWFDPISNALLIFGSRFCLIFSPLFFYHFKGNSIPVAILVAALGTLFILLPGQIFLVVGAVLIGTGVSVAGYLIRAYASESISAASRNKIAINSGVIVAGIALSLPMQSNAVVASVSFIFLLIAAYIARHAALSRACIDLPAGSTASMAVRLAWVLLGLTMGIKLYSPFTLLPQYIVATTGSLAQWYGLIVLASSFFIVVFQQAIVKITSGITGDRGAMFTTFLAMFIGLCVIANPGLFHAATFYGALMWVLALSMVECFASYLDVFGARNNCLFIKEVSVGVGGGLCALVSRFYASDIAASILAVIGVVFLVAAVLIIVCSNLTGRLKAV